MILYRTLILSFFVILYTVSALMAETVYNKRTEIDFNSNEFSDSIKVTIRIDGNVYGADGKENVDHLEGPKKYLANIFTKSGINHSYKFYLQNITAPKFCTIYSSGMSESAHAMAFQFMLDPGDQVFINQKNARLFFRGKDAKKYELQYNLYSIYRNRPFTMINYDITERDIKQNGRYFSQLDSLAEMQQMVLDQYKKYITPDIYWLIKSNIVYFYEGFKLMHLDWAYQINSNNQFQGAINGPIFKFLINYKKPLWNYQLKRQFDQIANLKHSLNYLDLQRKEYIIDSCFLRRKAYNITDCYSYFVRKYSGDVREWVIYCLLNDAKKAKIIDDNFAFCVEDALANGYVRNKTIKNTLDQFKTANIPGAPAFNFSLADFKGNSVHLSDFKGKIVVLDFWYIGCGNCAALHPILDSIAHSSTGEKFALVSICIDYNGKSKNGWPAAVLSNEYTSPADINLFAPGVAGKDPLIAKWFNIDACPTLIIVDKHGELMRRPVDPRVDRGADLVSIINHQDKIE
jgi:thiol-disulfide isomerase/thioredoxin